MKQKKRSPIRKAVIPVAGFGTRFLPATIAQPKEMLTVVDTPVIQYIVEEMAAAGIEEIIFVTGRNKRAIEDHFDYSQELEQSLKDTGKTDVLKEVHRISRLAKFVYVRQNKMLGNGHALLMAKEVVGNEPFAFSFGDDIIVSRRPAIGQLIESYRRYRSPIVGTMKVEPELVSRYGIVEPKDTPRTKTFGITKIIEKPALGEAPSLHAVTGRYIFTPDIFKALEKSKPSQNGELYIADAINILARRNRVYGQEISGTYYDCGNKLEYMKANFHFALQRPDIRPELQRFLRKLR